jgi:SAM-dependent methyltransferase
MSSPPTSPSDFAGRAAGYDRLRPGFPDAEATLVREADLRGRRVLDVGSGTGRFAARLAEEELAKVWGVDREPRMVEVARARGSRAEFKVGEAERLPFKDGWFERVTMLLSVQHLDRPRALAEARRVLGPDGRYGCLSFDPDAFHLGTYVHFFPSMLAADRDRFPDERTLRAELADAGFSEVRVLREPRSDRAARDDVLERMRARHISTFDFVPDDEYREGLARAERELPDVVESGNVILIVVARV